MKICALSTEPKYALYNQAPHVLKQTNLKQEAKPSYIVPGYQYFNPLSFGGTIDIGLRAKTLDTIDKQEPLSSKGYKGIVYSIDYNGNKYVAKIARSQEFSFENEAKILKKIPANLQSSQRFVDYFKNEQNRDILISTYVQGQKDVLNSKEDFEKYYNILLRLDKAGVLHGDLNMENCLFDDGSISIIDYGEGSIFKPGDSYDGLYPSFIAKSNAVNLEHCGIADCIQEWHLSGENTKDKFATFLKAKSEFYSEHIKLMQRTVNTHKVAEYTDYEQNLSKVLKNPAQRVIDNEARRIDLIYAFEYADTSVNYQKIPKDGIRNWSIVLQKALSAMKNVQVQLSDPELSLDERKYFEYQQQLFDRLYTTFCNWSGGTFYWFGRIMATPDEQLSVQEKTLKSNADKETDFIAPALYSYIMREN